MNWELKSKNSQNNHIQSIKFTNTNYESALKSMNLGKIKVLHQV